MLEKTALAAIAMLALFASSALAATRGTTMLAIQLGSGTADLYDPSDVTTTGFISAFDHSEIQAQAQCWKMMSDDYAFVISGGFGFFGEENEPGTAAAPGATTFKYSQTSFNVRVGGDRVVSVGDRASLYFGPGIEYWNGKAKFEGSGPTVETEGVSRISLSGRIGGIMNVGSNWGLALDMGHKLGRASAEDRGAKATTWASSFDAHGGLIFQFAGK